MISSPIRSHLISVAVCLLLVAAAWRVLTLGLADHYSAKQALRALGWRANHPAALVEAAQQGAADRPDHARELALAALRANPLEGRAYRVLGQLAEQNGDTTQALRLYEIAAARSPRDLATHAWLEREYLRQGQFDKALSQLDLLLRVQPEVRDSQFPLLTKLVGVPQAHPAVVQLLATNPPWRESFVTALCAQAPDKSGDIAPFMARLRRAPGGLSAAELSAWLDRLGRDHRWGEAYLTWVAALPDEQQADLANVFNGGFEREPSNAGFDWRFGQVPGAYIERLPIAGADGKLALRVSFDNRRVPFRHVSQLLALAPGSYRLEGKARADSLRSERGLVWTVACADDGQVLAATEPLTGHAPWRAFSVAFTVPAANCSGQKLVLAVPARIAAEQRIGGSVWFDDIRIRRQR